MEAGGGAVGLVDTLLGPEETGATRLEGGGLVSSGRWPLQADPWYQTRSCGCWWYPVWVGGWS